MNKINIGIIGYGVVGQGVVQILLKKRKLFRDQYGKDLVITQLCDRSLHKKDTSKLNKNVLGKDIDAVIKDDDVSIIIELIGGMNPAKKIVVESLKRGKHVITANKELIANCGKELFALATKNNCRLYFESAVGAGIPIIKTASEGLAGNTITGIYGIINGTCNFILDEMSTKDLTFDQALKDAQDKGYAESDPTLDINGMDTTHKLAVLVYQAFGKFLPVKSIYTEGITHISHDDIAYAERLNLSIKLLAIAKRSGNQLEVRVHPTLISKKHPLATINGVLNAAYFETDPLGPILLSGQGAGQMAAASGVISDVINCVTTSAGQELTANHPPENDTLAIKDISEIKTKFYLRIQASDRPGVLATITKILGDAGIGINSVSQTIHDKASNVPVVLLTDYATEKQVRSSLAKIQKLAVVKGKPVAIRMENL